MFTEKFGKYVVVGDKITCEVDGFKATATIHADDGSSPPWERSDGHGPVSEWTARDARDGERVIAASKTHFRYYDFAEALRAAKRDGWDSKPYGEGTADERALRAAEADFTAMKAWCDDEWAYFAVAVTVEKCGVKLTGDYEHAVFGIDGNYPDSDNGYLAEVANDLLAEAVEAAKSKIAELTASDPNDAPSPKM